MQNESSISASILIGMEVLNFYPARSFDNLPKVMKAMKLIQSFLK